MSNMNGNGDYMKQGSVCNICGTTNLDGTKFCVKCGNNLSSLGNDNLETKNTINSILSSTSEIVADVNEQSKVNVNSNMEINTKFDLFGYIKDVILKPYEYFKKHEKQLENKNNVLILFIFVVGSLVLLSLISSMISSVKVTSLFTNETTWVWQNLKNVEYFKLFIQNALVYTSILLLISGVYYLAALILKKSVNFIKIVSVVTTAMLPTIISLFVLFQILSLFSFVIGLIVALIGVIYSIVIMVELMNDIIYIDNKDIKIYFQVICWSINTIIVGYFVYRFVLVSLTSGLGSLIGF